MIDLTEDELSQLRGLGQGQVPAVVTQIVAARVAAVEAEREPREWRSEDGDRRCQRCGHPNPMWFIENDLWNRVTGTPDNPRGEGIVLCRGCFHQQRAQAAEAEVGRLGLLLSNAEEDRDAFDSERLDAQAEVARLADAFKSCPRHPHWSGTVLDCVMCNAAETENRRLSALVEDVRAAVAMSDYEPTNKVWHEQMQRIRDVLGGTE